MKWKKYNTKKSDDLLQKIKLSDIDLNSKLAIIAIWNVLDHTEFLRDDIDGYSYFRVPTEFQPKSSTSISQ